MSSIIEEHEDKQYNPYLQKYVPEGLNIDLLELNFREEETLELGNENPFLLQSNNIVNPIITECKDDFYNEYKAKQSIQVNRISSIVSETWSRTRTVFLMPSTLLQDSAKQLFIFLPIIWLWLLLIVINKIILHRSTKRRRISANQNKKLELSKLQQNVSDKIASISCLCNESFDLAEVRASLEDLEEFTDIFLSRMMKELDNPITLYNISNFESLEECKVDTSRLKTYFDRSHYEFIEKMKRSVQTLETSLKSLIVTEKRRLLTDQRLPFTLFSSSAYLVLCLSDQECLKRIEEIFYFQIKDLAFSIEHFVHFSETFQTFKKLIRLNSLVSRYQSLHRHDDHHLFHEILSCHSFLKAFLINHQILEVDSNERLFPHLIQLGDKLLKDFQFDITNVETIKQEYSSLSLRISDRNDNTCYDNTRGVISRRGDDSHFSQEAFSFFQIAEFNQTQLLQRQALEFKRERHQERLRTAYSQAQSELQGIVKKSTEQATFFHHRRQEVRGTFYQEAKEIEGSIDQLKRLLIDQQRKRNESIFLILFFLLILTTLNNYLDCSVETALIEFLLVEKNKGNYSFGTCLLSGLGELLHRLQSHSSSEWRRWLAFERILGRSSITLPWSVWNVLSFYLPVNLSYISYLLSYSHFLCLMIIRCTLFATVTRVLHWLDWNRADKFSHLLRFMLYSYCFGDLLYVAIQPFVLNLFLPALVHSLCFLAFDSFSSLLALHSSAREYCAVYFLYSLFIISWTSLKDRDRQDISSYLITSLANELPAIVSRSLPIGIFC